MHGRKKEVTYFPAGLDREISYVNIHNYVTKEDTVYFPDKQIGKGSYGAVRVFVSENGEQIAVKSLLEKTVVLADIQTRKREANKVDMEFILYNQAVPDDDISALFHYNKSYTVINEDGESQRIHEQSYRRVMRFVKGVEFNDFCKININYSHELLALFLQMARALQEIHDNGVAHGDISSRNILVDELLDKYIVTFIDYGLAYFLDGNADVGYLHDRKKNMSYSMAPERFKHHNIPAHPAQDIHPFAVTMKRALGLHNTEWRTYFLQKYTFVHDFIEKGQEYDASKRLDLKDFMIAAEAALDWEARLSDPEKKLLAALRLMPDTDIKRPLKYTRKSLSDFIIMLIKHREFTCAAHLINAKPEIDLTQANQYFATSKNKQDHSGNTIAHVATKLNCLPLLAAVLNHGPDLSLENADKKTAQKLATAKQPKFLIRLHLFKEEVQAAKTHNSSFFSKSPRAKKWNLIDAANCLEQMIITGFTPENAADQLEFIQSDMQLNKIYSDLTKNKIIPHITTPDKSFYERMTKVIWG